MKAVVLTKKAMILEYVEVVRFEIEGGKKKKISASNDELVQKIWDRLMGEAMNFSTEKEHRRHLESVTREMLWLEANTEESDEIIRRLKWRKRSIPTHSEWLYPLTFDAGKGLKRGLKNGALPFNID